MNISTKSNQLILALMVSFFSLMLACKSKEEIVIPPNQPPGNFNVTSTLATNGQDVILKWTKSKDPDGDAVTYSVVYTDTLARNLSDTTYTIKNLPFETEIKGSVVAKDTKGSKAVSNFSIKTGTQYVIVPDLNFEKRLIELKIDDVLDGKILRNNVLKVTTLNISGVRTNEANKITTLIGIEAFINLKIFDCSYNKISEVDVSTFPDLTYFYCSNNKLTKLDVSNNLALSSLVCFYNNLTILDLRKNISLNSLACFGNNLNSLDVSTNTVLEFLNCSENNLTILDLSKNTLLTMLQCYSNTLTSLNLSKNLTLTLLNCSGNKLSNLDLSNHIVLTTLSCAYNEYTDLDLSKNLALKEIFVYDNKLTSLNLGKNTSLTELWCQNNKIQTICLNNLNQVKTTWQKDPTATYKVCP